VHFTVISLSDVSSCILELKYNIMCKYLVCVQKLIGIEISLLHDIKN